MRRARRCIVPAATAITAIAAVIAVAAAATGSAVDTVWMRAAQPAATVLLAVALVVAAVSVTRAVTAQRRMLARGHQLDLEPMQVRELRTRMLDGARLLAAPDATLRLTAVYEVLAVADDWCRIARRSTRPHRALVEHRRCLDLICGYLRANRRLERFVPGTYLQPGEEHDERVVREQLCAGTAAHLHTWRHLGPFHLDLSGADLAGMRLRNSPLAGLTGRELVLTDADLTGSDLSGADLTDATATNVRLAETNLQGATLIRITAPHASFNGADATGAVFTDATLRAAQLLDVTVDRADFTGADLRVAKLMRIDLRTAAWASADLTGADLTDATPATVRDRKTSLPAVPDRSDSTRGTTPVPASTSVAPGAQ